jgi:putative hemolysin
MYWVEFIEIFALVVLNGVLAMAELAIVSARPQRLQAMAEAGNAGAGLALALARDPGRLLSTVQTGITLIGVLVGALSGATLAHPLAEYMRQSDILPGFADEAAFALVVSVSTYLTLIIGELVPKQLGLRHADTLAVILAPPVHWLAVITAPAVFLLDRSSRALLSLFGAGGGGEEVTEEEVKILIDEGTKAGIFEPAEQDMFVRVMRFADRAAASLMTPRVDIEWLALDENLDSLIQKVCDGGHSRYPVGRDGLDEIQGVVYARDILAAALKALDSGERKLNLQPFLKPLPAIHESTPALKSLELMRAAQAHVALVVDEYGQVEGLVTVTDVLEALVGELPEGGREDDPSAVQREDGSWLLDGSIPVEEIKHLFNFDELPDEDRYETLAGFIMASLGAVPHTGAIIRHAGLKFEVVDMDGRRVDKVLVAKEGTAA